jgi:CspA family cold shock protein
LNARQKRLFEESRKKNPNLKIPTETPQPDVELTEEDLALLKQGVGDKTSRPPSAQSAASAEAGSWQTGAIVKYFEDKGYGFIRPENGGKDVFFHISRLTEGEALDLVPGAKVGFEVGMDRYGKPAATSLRLLPAAEA